MLVLTVTGKNTDTLVTSDLITMRNILIDEAYNNNRIDGMSHNWFDQINAVYPYDENIGEELTEEEKNTPTRTLTAELISNLAGDVYDRPRSSITLETVPDTRDAVIPFVATLCNITYSAARKICENYIVECEDIDDAAYDNDMPADVAAFVVNAAQHAHNSIVVSLLDDISALTNDIINIETDLECAKSARDRLITKALDQGVSFTDIQGASGLTLNR